MSPQPIAREAVLEHLERVLSSAAFHGAERSTAILRFLIERTLDGQSAALKEYTIGAEALGRGVGFDPRTDPIVRAEVSRLRSRLDRYYSTEGRFDRIVIELPKGTYVARFAAREAEGSSSDRVEPARRTRARALVWALVGSLATFAAFAVGAWLARSASPSMPPPFVSFDIQLQPAGVVGSEVGSDIALSPDGARVVFVSTDSTGVSRLRARRFDGSPPSDLPGTSGARGPFFSPDGRWVGFWSGGKLQKTSLDGGSPVVICPATDLLGASWGADGSIIAALDATGRLFRVSSEGGAPVVAVAAPPSRASALWPQVLPDGKHVLYTATAGPGADRANIEVVSPSSGKRTILIKGGTFGRYVRPGYLIYVNQGTLYAVRFDLERMELGGSSIPILDDVAYSSTFGYAQMDVSASGTVVYRRAAARGRLVVAMLDASGHTMPLIAAPGRYVWPALSPDGRRLAVSVTESGVSSVSIFENLNGVPRRVVSVVGCGAPVWTPDGRFLVVQAASGLALVRVDGGRMTRLLETGGIAVPWSFSADGGQLAYYAMSATTAFDIWSVAINRGDSTLRAGPARPILRSPAFEVYPAISPDGRWLAYTSNESGTWEVYVRAMDAGAALVQVSRGGGRVPRWSKSGNELFYSTDDQRLMVVGYAVDGHIFGPRPPRQWTTLRLGDTGVLSNFDVYADGRHIVALLPAARPDSAHTENQAVLMLNFADELRRRLR